MFSIKPGCIGSADEELRAVSITTSICHRDGARSKMTNLEVFICKSTSIDATTTTAITRSEITTLDHEVWDDTMEFASLVAEALLSGAKCTEVFYSTWNGISVQTDNNTTLRKCKG